MKAALLAGIFGAQRSNDEPEGSRRGRDRKSRQGDAGDFRNGRFPRPEGAPSRRRRSTTRPTTRPASYGRRRMPEPAHLDQAREGCGRTHQQAAVRGLDVNAVVADQPREGKGAVRRRGSAQTRGTDLPAPAAPRISTARAPTSTAEAWMVAVVSIFRVMRAHVTSPAGAPRSARRAPSAPRPVATPMRFSARMRPPCASTIWREIERPRPEFWPNPDAAGRCRSARRCAPSLPAGCRARRRRP